MIAIIRLLASVARPSYQNYVDRTDLATPRVDIDSIEQEILPALTSVPVARSNNLAELSMNNLRAPGNSRTNISYIADDNGKK